MSDKNNNINELLEEDKKYLELYKENPLYLLTIPTAEIGNRVCVHIIREDASAIKYVPDEFEEAFYEAFRISPSNINFFTPYMTLKFLFKNYKLIQYIENPSSQIYAHAISMNKNSLKYMKRIPRNLNKIEYASLSNTVREYIFKNSAYLKRDSSAVKILKDHYPDSKVAMFCRKYNGNCFNHIENPSEEFLFSFFIGIDAIDFKNYLSRKDFNYSTGHEDVLGVLDSKSINKSKRLISRYLPFLIFDKENRSETSVEFSDMFLLAVTMVFKGNINLNNHELPDIVLKQLSCYSDSIIKIYQSSLECFKKLIEFNPRVINNIEEKMRASIAYTAFKLQNSILMYTDEKSLNFVKEFQEVTLTSCNISIKAFKINSEWILCVDEHIYSDTISVRSLGYLKYLIGSYKIDTFDKELLDYFISSISV